MRDAGKTVVIPATGRVQVSDGEGLRRLALAGVGLVRLAAFTVREDIAAGRLVPVLDHLDTGETEMFHAVYVGQRGPLPPAFGRCSIFWVNTGGLSEVTQKVPVCVSSSLIGRT